MGRHHRLRHRRARCTGDPRQDFDRVLGTVAGAALGYLFAAFIADHLLFSLLVAGTAAFTLYAQERMVHGYAVLLGGVTVMLVLFGSLITPAQSLDLAVDRALEISVGVVVACVVDWVFAGDLAGTAAAAPKPGVWVLPVDKDLLAIALTGGVAVAAVRSSGKVCSCRAWARRRSPRSSS